MGDEVQRIAAEVRGARSDLRARPLANLVEVAQDSKTRSAAIAALLELCEEGFVERGNLLPHERTVLALCNEALSEARPAQGDPRNMGWLVDSAYSPIRYQTGLLLDVAGYLPMESARPVLRTALSMTDPRLKLIAALSLLRNLELVDPEELDAIASSHEVRIHLWEQLQQLQMEALMPEQWSSSDQLAASELSRWIAHPMELGTPPEEIELMERFPVRVDFETLDVYLFRFRECTELGQPNRGWMAGIAGPYKSGEFLRSCWSSFESWESRTPEEHFRKMEAIVSG